MHRLVGMLLILAVPAAAQQKKRVAVLDFEYGTVRSFVASIFGTDQDVGRGIADLIVEKLVQDGSYSVIERKALEKVLTEQNFSNSDRADSSTAARIGRVLGVDAIVIGSITQFGRDDKSTGVAGGALSRVTGRYGLGGVKRTESKAVVGISARMVDTETAEVLATAKGLGESTRTGTNLLGAGGGSVAAGGAVDMTSRNFAATILGEAVNQSVTQLSRELVTSSARLPTRKLVIDGLVADVAGSTVILNVGSKAGVKVGDRLQVRRKIREVRDPASGKILRSIEDKIGEVVITEVDERSAVGTFAGAAPAKVGDVVRN
ncbi:MAG: curli production assembly protein CsgG [Acidobacteria bacterium]|nr:curli production assembly protein CsgG [Acidobacteriota bacterium]